MLGVEQTRITAGIRKPGTVDEAEIDSPTSVPTPWNQLEAGVLLGLGLPLLIFKDPDVGGGIFDLGASDVFVHADAQRGQRGRRRRRWPARGVPQVAAAGQRALLPRSALRSSYQPRSASRCGCGISSTLMPTIASPSPRDTLASTSGSS